MLTENTTKKIAKQLILAEVSNYGKSVLTDTFLAELSSQKKNKQQKPHHSELTANFIHLLNNAKKKNRNPLLPPIWLHPTVLTFSPHSKEFRRTLCIWIQIKGLEQTSLNTSKRWVIPVPESFLKGNEIIKTLYLSQHLSQGFFWTDCYVLAPSPPRFPLSITPTTHAETQSNKTLEK